MQTEKNAAKSQPKNGPPAQTATPPASMPGAPPVAGPQALAVSAPRQSIGDLLERAKDKLAQVMPRHLSVDRLIRVTLACINRTPKLLECTRASLLNSIMQAAQLGLEPTGVLGSAYLVPYKNKGVMECQLIVGYRGLIDLARRSGQIESIEAHVVHANDRFSCRYGLEPKLEHEPAWEGEPGPVKAVYAIAKLKDGGKQIEVMTLAQIDAIKKQSKAGAFGPWVDHFDEMARKTVVRRIAKYLPLTPELADAMALDAEAEERLDEQDLSAAPKGVAGLKSLAKASDTVIEAVADEPPHDAETGEVREPGADDDSEAPEAETEPLTGADGKPL